MTHFIDVHIHVDPEHPDALNPGLEFMAWVSYSNPTRDRENRKRFMSGMLSAIYGQDGRHMPSNSDFRRIKCENIAGTAHKTVRRIASQRAPAVLMTLRQIAKGGNLDVSRAGLTQDEQARLADAFAEAAGRLRGQRIVPTKVRDIDRDVWRDARPALAMAAALPISWTGTALKGDDVFRVVALLCTTPGWVPNAVENARELAFKFEWHLGRNAPPTLLVPRRRIIKGEGAELIPLRHTALHGLLNRPAA